LQFLEAQEGIELVEQVLTRIEQHSILNEPACLPRLPGHSRAVGPVKVRIRLAAGGTQTPQSKGFRIGGCTKIVRKWTGGLDVLRSRSVLRYAAAKAMENTFFEEMKVKGRDLVDKVKSIVHEGNVRRIILKDEKGQTFLEIPLSIAAVGVIAAPLLAGLGAIAALVANFTLVVERVKEDPPKQ
jgi:hypothetical protein